MEVQKQVSLMNKEVRDRVQEEKRDLSEKLDKLVRFILSPEFSKLSYESKDLLFKQWFLMREYRNVLSSRLHLDDKERSIIYGKQS